MPLPFQRAAVLGAGVMGAQIAAHFANAGVPVLLLDVTPDAAAAGLTRLKTLSPDPCFTPEVLARITIGGFDTDAARLATADWVIEAVVESLDAKRALLSRLAPHVSSAAVVSSNTSAIPLAEIAAALPETMRPRWLGTHFFNPPRYLRLLELIPTGDTARDVLARVADFADRRLGKGVVVANDRPGFIANRIGVYGALRAVEAVETSGFTIAEVDAVTGPVLGRPKSATFRTLDLAGVDILVRVASDLAARLDDPACAPSPLLRTMVERGLLGEKAGRGFYQRQKTADGSRILALDPATLEFVEPAPVRLLSLDAAARMADVRERVKALFLGRDRAGDLLRRTLGPTLIYAARIAGEIASSDEDVDEAMRLGFGWELGPFELWDAIGIRAVLDACGVTDPPPLVREALDEGRDTIRLPSFEPLRVSLLGLYRPDRTVTRNPGASLVDIGEDVLCVEFHSKLNTLGGDAVAMIEAGVAEASRNFKALVVGNDAEQFSAGANLMLVLMEAQEGHWDEIDAMVRAFQRAMMAMKTAPVPVVAAPAGLALGGGCEVCLHAAQVRAAAETYMGLVEVGAGLLPAGGGTKELLVRAIDRAGGADAEPFVRAAFETIGFGKTSTSAADAARLGYLRDRDRVTMNRRRVIEDARRDALALADAGWQPVAPRDAIPVGGGETLARLALGIHLALRAGRITEHDALIGRRIGQVLAGGTLPHAGTVSEQTLLDLEREAFLGLCGERKTQERMAHLLKTGKPLRN